MHLPPDHPLRVELNDEAHARPSEALRAPLVALEACGHVPYVEQPEALAAALHAFLVPAA